VLCGVSFLKFLEVQLVLGVHCAVQYTVLAALAAALVTYKAEMCMQASGRKYSKRIAG
jgi:hypothetical protein